MSTTQAKLDKNKTKSVEVNVRPSLLGQSGKSNFIIWVTVCDALTCGFKSCSYNPLCVWVNARNERNLFCLHAIEWMFQIIKDC